MTYFAFLSIFVGLPLLAVAILLWLIQRTGRRLPRSLQAWPALPILGVHILLAVLYTTPWDNYLVATRVWWYDPALVTGLTLGYVPIEEYTFFIVQTILVGLWMLLLACTLPPPATPFRPRPGLRRWLGGSSAIVWAFGVYLLLSGNRPGTYLGLELAWAMIPITVQLAFGADILWHHRRLLAWSLVPSILYLALADGVAIQAGTWTIDPQQSLPVLLGGVLPLEEFVFFMLTSTLVVFGMILMLARPSHQRVRLPASLQGVPETT